MTFQPVGWLSNRSKRARIRQIFGPAKPTELWYFLGFEPNITTQDLNMVLPQLFLMPHKIRGLYGIRLVPLSDSKSCSQKGSFYLLYAHGFNKQKVPLEITVRNTRCPLFAVRHDEVGVYRFLGESFTSAVKS